MWEAFLSLHSGRTAGMGGPNPLSWSEIQAWCNLTGADLSLWEIEVIKSLDRIWIEAMSED